MIVHKNVLYMPIAQSRVHNSTLCYLIYQVDERVLEAFFYGNVPISSFKQHCKQYPKRKPNSLNEKSIVDNKWCHAAGAAHVQIQIRNVREMGQNSVVLCDNGERLHESDQNQHFVLALIPSRKNQKQSNKYVRPSNKHHAASIDCNAGNAYVVGRAALRVASFAGCTEPSLMPIGTTPLRPEAVLQR
jgi:hypothetical protein